VTLEFIPNEDRVTPPDSAGFSMMMLLSTPSGGRLHVCRARTNGRKRRLLAQHPASVAANVPTGRYLGEIIVAALLRVAPFVCGYAFAAHHATKNRPSNNRRL
jgi:hypothetical protein